MARRKRARTPARCPQSYDRALQKLAAKLALRVPWLGRGHLGALCQTLALAGVDPTRWDVPGLLWAIDARNRELGWDAPIPETQHRRLRLLAHQLAQVLPVYAEAMTPTEAAHRRAQEATTNAEATVTEEPVERACPAEDPDLAQSLQEIRERAQVEAKAQQARKEAIRAQAEADKAERAERAKADREAAEVGPVVAPSRGGESQAARIVRQKSRWKRFGLVER